MPVDNPRIVTRSGRNLSRDARHFGLRNGQVHVSRVTHAVPHMRRSNLIDANRYRRRIGLNLRFVTVDLSRTYPRLPSEQLTRIAQYLHDHATR